MPFLARMLSVVGITPISSVELTFIKYTIGFANVGENELYPFILFLPFSQGTTQVFSFFLRWSSCTAAFTFTVMAHYKMDSIS
jgi:hypothetical protein